MQAQAALSSEWRDWIIENLARGCAPQMLVDDMVRQRFDHAEASAHVMRLAAREVGVPDVEAPATHAGVAKPSVYVDETPRLPAGNVIHTHDRDVRVALRVAKPAVAVLHDVLSLEECEELIRRSRSKLARSTTVDPKSGRYEVISERTSEGTFFERGADDFIARIERRLSELMGMPVENGEGLQILHYGVGGEYRPHFDYFPPDDPGSEVVMATGGQRVSTMVMYLNAVEDGGGTIFPELGLEVLPQPGSAVYFEYCNSRGQIDPRTLHGGSPVRAGEKWIVTKWVRQRRYG